MNFPLPFLTTEQVALQAVDAEPDLLTLYLATTGSSSACPCCGSFSQHVHSRYVRTLRDLPALGTPVRLRLTARRFFCRADTCPRRVFTERLPDLVAPYARCTRRLSEVLQRVALAIGGEGGCRLAHVFGMSTSADRLLEGLHRLPATAPATPRVLGIDDWAWKRGHRYGTILVDLEQRRVVDLLPDRSADGLATWLELHPGVEVITRDRANAYAEGATRGAPDAVQVADRWHLLYNLTEAVERILEKQAGRLKTIPVGLEEEPTPEASAEASTEASAAEPQPAPSPALQAQAARRARRKACYEEVVKRREQGWTLKAIAEAVGLSVRTLQRWLTVGCFPERKQRARATSKLDPYRTYLDARVRQGCTNAAQLWRELQAQGFDGQRGIVGLYVRELRRGVSSRASPAKWRPTLRRTAWLLTRAEDEVSKTEHLYVEALTVHLPELAEVQALAVEFSRLLRAHDVGAFDVWLARAEQSALAGFAASLRTDERAVRAAVSEPWSNGPVEGQVNRLKLVKRQMYGRGGFAVLRARVVAAA